MISKETLSRFDCGLLPSSMGTCLIYFHKNLMRTCSMFISSVCFFNPFDSNNFILIHFDLNNFILLQLLHRVNYMPPLSPSSIELGRLDLTSFQDSFSILICFRHDKTGLQKFKLSSFRLITLNYCTSFPQENSEMSCLTVSKYKNHAFFNSNIHFDSHERGAWGTCFVDSLFLINKAPCSQKCF